jgi:hypothetical protein
MGIGWWSQGAPSTRTLVAAERLEGDELVDAVDELGAEVLLDVLHHALAHAVAVLVLCTGTGKQAQESQVAVEVRCL